MARRTLSVVEPPGTANPLQPAFAQLDLQREFPNVFGAAITVRVTPLTMPEAPPTVAAPRIWAFATAVRNDNNEVAVFSPRCDRRCGAADALVRRGSAVSFARHRRAG